jgi:hypothetical protein
MGRERLFREHSLTPLESAILNLWDAGSTSQEISTALGRDCRTILSRFDVAGNGHAAWERMIRQGSERLGARCREVLGMPGEP